MQAWRFFDQMIDIADDDSEDLIELKDAEGNVTKVIANTSKLRRDEIMISSRKWHLSHVLPKTFSNNKRLNPLNNQVNVITSREN